MNQSEPQIPDELLSAYLDGELSAAELAQVDNALGRDERLQTVLSELRQVRDDLRSLPRHQLPQGFADRIVQACVQQNEEVATSKSQPLASPGRRRLITVILATAASITVAAWAINPFNWGGIGEPRQVAQTDTEPDSEPTELGLSVSERDVEMAIDSDLRREDLDVTNALEPETESLQFAREAVPRLGESNESKGLGSRAVPTTSSEGRNETPSRGGQQQASDEDTAVSATIANLAASIELKGSADEMRAVKRQIQSQQDKQLGLTVTELTSSSQEAGRFAGFGGYGQPVDAQPYYYAAPEQDADDQPVELLLVEGTTDQISMTVQDLKISSNSASVGPLDLLQANLTPEQFGFPKLASKSSGVAARPTGRERQVRSRRLESLSDDAGRQLNRPAEDLAELNRARGVPAEPVADSTPPPASFADRKSTAAPTPQAAAPPALAADERVNMKSEELVERYRTAAPPQAATTPARTLGEQAARPVLGGEQSQGVAGRYRILFVLRAEPPE